VISEFEASLIYRVSFRIEDSQGYIEKPCLRKTKPTNQKKKKKKKEEAKSLLFMPEALGLISSTTEERRMGGGKGRKRKS
jgi:hypothetical protein